MRDTLLELCVQKMKLIFKKEIYADFHTDKNLSISIYTGYPVNY